jgi:hypothetical protein
MATKITRDIIESYLNCKYKGYLKLSGESGKQSDYDTMTYAAKASSREQVTPFVGRRIRASIWPRRAGMTRTRGRWCWGKTGPGPRCNPTMICPRSGSRGGTSWCLGTIRGSRTWPLGISASRCGRLAGTWPGRAGRRRGGNGITAGFRRGRRCGTWEGLSRRLTDLSCEARSAARQLRTSGVSRDHRAWNVTSPSSPREAIHLPVEDRLVSRTPPSGAQGFFGNR